jgi:oxygen-dependent protoporphyrinogen oxidase
MQVLTDALAAAVGPLSLQTRATAIERHPDGGFTVRAEQDGRSLVWRARALVLATPADQAAALLKDHAADAAAALEAIDYAPVATVASAYARSAIAHPLDGFGCLVPRKEMRRVLGVLFSSSMYDGRAPQDQVLLTTFAGGQRDRALPRLAEDEIGAIAQAEHRALLGARQAPLFETVTRWARAIPQYTLGHLGRVARADAAARQLPGLFFCANWKGGVSIGDCIKNGYLTADSVAAWVRQPA